MIPPITSCKAVITALLKHKSMGERSRVNSDWKFHIKVITLNLKFKNVPDVYLMFPGFCKALLPQI